MPSNKRVGSQMLIPMSFGYGHYYCFVLSSCCDRSEFFELLTQQLKQWITDSFSWFYVLSVAFFLILLIYIACSAIGRIKLGPDHSQPEYSNGSWFAMLFTAGMGIGLMFFGVAEPVMHYVNPPSGEPQTIEAAQQALRVTFSTGAYMHGQFTPWSV